MSITAASPVPPPEVATWSWSWHPAWSWLGGVHVAFSVTLIVVLALVVVIALNVSTEKRFSPNGFPRSTSGVGDAPSRIVADKARNGERHTE